MTCPVNVSLNGGYPDVRTRRRGQEPAEPPQVRGISVGFSASTTGTSKVPAPDARDPAGEHEEAELYADLEDSLRTWARSRPSVPQVRGAEQADPEAGA